MIKTRIKKLDFPRLDWAEVIELYDRHTHAIKKILKQGMEIPVNPAVNWATEVNRIDLPYRKIDSNYFSVILHHGHLNEKIKYARDEMFGDIADQYTCHVYISFSSYAQSFPLHTDSEAVFIWQLLGETPWKIDTCDNSNPLDDHSKCVYDDLIYIPRNVTHGAFPSCPRASVSFARSFVYLGDNYDMSGKKIDKPYEELPE
jgi:hypothetical protein